MSISYLAKSLPDSPTLLMNEAARKMRQQGDPVIHLGSGEPKSKVPIDAILAASSKLNSAEIRYTPSEGTPAMRQAVIRYTEEHYNKIIAPENTIICNGAKQAVSVFLQAVLDQQDEVIIPAPYWVSYPALAKIAFGVPKIVKPEDGRFQPRMKDIADAVTSYTKVIIINSPGNPGGVQFSEEFIAEIVEYCEKKGIYLVMDDIYHQLLFDGKKPVPAYKFAKDDSDKSKLVIINGVSKMYAMTGFRIGWAIANTRVIEAMVKVQSHTTSCPSALLQAAAVGALNGVQSSVESLRMTLQNNRDVMVNELKAFDGIKVTKPDGTFYCFPDFRAYSKTSSELAQFLLKKVMVVTVPGKEFGMEGFLRLSFCGSIKDITEGIERIKWALDPNSPNEIYIGDRKLVRDWL